MSVPGDLLVNVSLRLLLLKTMAETNRIAWKDCFSGTFAQNVFTYGILYFPVQVQKGSKDIKQIHMYCTCTELRESFHEIQHLYKSAVFYYNNLNSNRNKERVLYTFTCLCSLLSNGTIWNNVSCYQTVLITKHVLTWGFSWEI